MKMYSAACRLVERYGLAAIGIPYQLGLMRVLRRLRPRRGHAEQHGPPAVKDPETKNVVQKGKAIPHFNEGDMGAGVPQLLMHDILERKGLPTETTLHDVRWGREFDGKFVWVFLISGAAPPAHYGGWKKDQSLPPGRHVLPQGRRHLLRRLQARRHHLGPRL
jgi:hypothetical protein